MSLNHAFNTEATRKIHLVRADWDPEAEVWVATSADVPGLVTEANTLEALTDKLQHLVPELLKANGVAKAGEIPFELLACFFRSIT